MKPFKLSDKYSQLEKEKRLNPDYTTIERNAKKHGWQTKKPKKVKTRTIRKFTVPKVEQLPYKQFLKTKYWKYVRSLVIMRDGNKCTKCGSIKRLEAHHLTYKHHFTEHKHLDELVTLCRVCHQLEHKDKIEC